jgi:hypothetical protein
VFVRVFAEGVEDESPQVAEGFAAVSQHVNYSLGVQVYVLEVGYLLLLFRHLLLLFLALFWLVVPLDA